MRDREEGRSPELDGVRRRLFPELSPEEGWAQIERALDGAADGERWERIERIARERNLDQELLARLRELHSGS